MEEWLEAGPPLLPAGRRRVQQLVIVTAVVAVGSVVVGLFASKDVGRGSTEPPTPTATSSVRLPLQPSSAPTTLPVSWRVSNFLSGADLDLFARSQDRLYRIQTKSGRVTATVLPNSLSPGSLTFLAERSQVIIKGWDKTEPGVRVVDGRPAQPLPAALSKADQALLGPSGQLWVSGFSGQHLVTQLTDLDGKPVQPGKPFQPGRAGAAESAVTSYPFDGIQADGHRGLILSNAGGVYDLRRDGIRRLARGWLLAVGAHHVLVGDCDQQLRCSRYLIDRRTGTSRRVGPASTTADTTRTISDNGHYAAFWSWPRTPGGADGGKVLFVDLRTDTTLVELLDLSGNGDGGSLIWLPDQRLVGVVNQKLIVFNPRTRQVSTPDLKLGVIQQLTLRNPTRQ